MKKLEMKRMKKKKRDKDNFLVQGLDCETKVGTKKRAQRQGCSMLNAQHVGSTVDRVTPLSTFACRGVSRCWLHNVKVACVDQQQCHFVKAVKRFTVLVQNCEASW